MKKTYSYKKVPNNPYTGYCFCDSVYVMTVNGEATTTYCLTKEQAENVLSWWKSWQQATQ